MTRNFSESLIFIGAGNLASHLAVALFNAGYNIDQVYSHSEQHAKILAKKVNADYVSSFESISKSGNVYFVCVPDIAISEVLNELKIKNKLIVHVSGSTSIDVFKDNFANYGVFYPLQTFSKKRKVNFRTIPICVEANSEKTTVQLLEMAAKISENCYIVNSEKRLKLHLAAVFCCNFVNHLYTISSEILEKSGLDFEMLKPLIMETAKKISKYNPSEMQTGPAIRKDIETMEKHKNLLNYSKEYIKIYELLSDSIVKINN